MKKMSEVIMLSVGPWSDETAELSGYIIVNGAAMKFYANRHGALIGLTHDDGVMMLVNNLPISKSLQNEIVKTVYNGIDTYIRNEAIYNAISKSPSKSISCLCIDDIDR